MNVPRNLCVQHVVKETVTPHIIKFGKSSLSLSLEFLSHAILAHSKHLHDFLKFRLLLEARSFLLIQIVQRVAKEQEGVMTHKHTNTDLVYEISGLKLIFFSLHSFHVGYETCSLCEMISKSRLSP